ncbi:MAG: Ig-like domain-containing protein [Pirellulaceae bacterium]
MRLTTPAAALLLAALLAPASFHSLQADEKQQPPGLGDPGKLVSIALETGRQVDGSFVVAGRDAAQQLVVTGSYDSGQTRDLTRAVKYTASPDGIVTVDENGYVRPVAEGEATIHVASPEGPDATTKVKVTNIEQDLPVNFPNQIVPVFTKYGCNSGGCHGKSGGQNGFALSLLGFEPTEDFEYLVKEARGRRLFPAAPDAACCC